MAKRTFSPTERIGINAVEQVVLTGLGWIWREQETADFGVDGQIEVVGEEHAPTGKLFAVQVKTGPSYFQGSGGTVPLYVDEDRREARARDALSSQDNPRMPAIGRSSDTFGSGIFRKPKNF